MRREKAWSMKSLCGRLHRGWNLFRYHHPLQFIRRFQTLATRHFERLLPSTVLSNIESGSLRVEVCPLLRQIAGRRVELWPKRSTEEYLNGIAVGRFTFLNVTRDLRRAPAAFQAESITREAIDWNPDAPRLWRFHLQCQESVLNLAFAGHPQIAWDHIESWLRCERHRAPLIDPDAWHPFCISRRLPVWLMLAACFPPPASMEVNFWRSVAQQTEWLRTHQERDIGGNHLIENYRALAIAAVSLDGGIRINIPNLKTKILTEMSSQILPSGEHCERTPTYHCLMWLAAMEMAELFALHEGETEYVQRLRRTVRSMSNFSESILHPDGDIPLFGDSVFGETPSPTALFSTKDVKDVNRQSSVNSVTLDYWTDRPSDGNFLIVDLGQMVCDHLPAHGHADLLTLEASLNGRRVLVDSGVYDYEDSEMRNYCRSTAAHNTLQVNGKNHADIWSRFRMGARGHVRSCRNGTMLVGPSILGPRAAAANGVGIGRGDEIRWCAARHDAYQSLGVAATGRIVLSRTYGSTPDWIIIDWVATKRPVGLTNRLHFHPDLQLKMTTDGTVYWNIDRGEAQQEFQVQRLGNGEVDLLPGWYCPDFGVRRQNSVLTTCQSVRPHTPHPARLGAAGNTIAWCGWRVRSIENPLTVSVEIRHEKLAFTWLDTTGLFDLHELDLQSANALKT